MWRKLGAIAQLGKLQPSGAGQGGLVSVSVFNRVWACLTVFGRVFRGQKRTKGTDGTNIGRMGPMVKPAAPVHDGGQARAVAVCNGAGSLPGRRPVSPLQYVKERALARLSRWHDTTYKWESKDNVHFFAQRRRVRRVGIWNSVRKLLNINDMQPQGSA